MPRLQLSILSQVSIVHFSSHIHFMTIPALLPLLPEAMGIGFIEIGTAISVFNIVSALVQAPLGFAADRFGARLVLLVGLLVGSLAFLGLAFFPTYPGLLLSMAVAGAANGVYHPCDYAILSRSVPDSRMGKAFSIHSFAGYAGSAATPALLTGIAAFFSIPVAIAVSSAIGFLTIAQLLLPNPESAPAPGTTKKSGTVEEKPKNLRALWVPIGILTLLYVLLSLSGTSVERFSVSALIQGYGVTLPVANTALTFFLVCSAVGVLSGGALADKTKHHGYVAAFAYAIATCLVVAIVTCTLSPLLLVIIFSIIGFLTGVIVPSRDMLVRAVSPKGAEGKVFGIVTTGFNIGGTLGPLLCGFLLDNALPAIVFWSAAVFMLLTVAITLVQEKMTAQKPV